MSHSGEEHFNADEEILKTRREQLNVTIGVGIEDVWIDVAIIHEEIDADALEE